MKVGVNTVRKGNILEINGVLHEIIDKYLTQPGKGGAYAQIKLRNLDSGSQFEKRFRTSENVEKVILTDKKVQYLYSDPEGFYFMDSVTYEQFALQESLLGDTKNYLVENMDVMVKFHGEKPLTVELPPSVILQITYTEPGVKGNTVSGGATKPATLETGYEIQVPLFINLDEKIKVDTRTGSYIERAK